MMDSGQQETRDQIASVIRVDEFGLPASDDEIQRVEREFDVPFPAWLRSIYRACNGFTTRWNTQSLLPLDDVLRHREIMLTTFEDPEESLPDWLPRAIVFSTRAEVGHVPRTGRHWMINSSNGVTATGTNSILQTRASSTFSESCKTSGTNGTKNAERSLAFRNHFLPRRHRIEILGGVDHVMNRGVDRADIVRDDEDRYEWFRLFNPVAARALGADLLTPPLRWTEGLPVRFIATSSLCLMETFGREQRRGQVTRAERSHGVSVGPIFDTQAGDSAEVGHIASHNDVVAGQCNRRDSQIVRADAEFAPQQSLVFGDGLHRETQNRKLAQEDDRPCQTVIGLRDTFRCLRSSQGGVPAGDLLIDCDH